MKIIFDSEAGERLDFFLARKIPKLSRSKIQQAIKDKKILINNKSVKSSEKVLAEDEIEIDYDYFSGLNKPLKLKPEEIPISILFEDKDILIIDKPADMVVHPADGNHSGTLVNAILNYNPKIADAIGHNSNFASFRPGIVHRLDKDTSGVIIVAKNSDSLLKLSKLLAEKKIQKTYFALVYGDTAKSGKIESYIGRNKNDRKKMAITDLEKGKLATTKYKKIKSYIFMKEVLSLLSVEIPTGRTHQIRVQMQSIGHPVIGDQKYFYKNSKKISDLLRIKRQLLHASQIQFIHPTTHNKVWVKSELPADFQIVLNKLF